MTRRARPSPDKPDAIGKDPGSTLPHDSLSRLPGPPNAASRVEQAEAYRAAVDVAYRHYGTERGGPRTEKNERWAIAPVSSCIEGDAADRRQEEPGDLQTGKPSLAKGPTGDAFFVRRDDSPYCPVSELKGDEPATAERLMKAPEFNGEGLRGFKDTNNPDFIDDYRRTYDAVGGPTAWSSPRLNMTRMINQIHRHIYDKDGIDFTVVDLTGASSAQAGEVFENLDRWESDPTMHPKSKIIILGDGY